MTPYHRIVSLEVDDGFLEAARVDFAGHLTCVIGSRGSGKTTLLELVRYALNQAPTEPLSKDLKKLLDKNLKPGRIRLVVEDASGRRFAIERLWNEAPKVFEEPSGRAIVDGWDKVFRADYFTQAEIAVIAEEPARQLALLDSFIAGELATLNGERMTIERKLDEQVALIKNDTAAANELIGFEEQLGANAKRLSELKPADETVNAAKEKAIAAQVHRTKEAEQLGLLIQSLRAGEEEVQRAKVSVSAKLNVSGFLEVLQGENGTVLQPVAAAMASLSSVAAETFDALMARFATERERASLAQVSLKELHLKQNVATDQILKQDTEARERLEIEKQQAKLTATQDRFRALQASKATAQAERQKLVDDLAKVVDRRSAGRRRQVAKLNEALESGFGVRFVLREGADTSRLQVHLEGALRGSHKQGQREIIQKLVLLEPRVIGKYVLTSMRQALAKETGLSDEQVSWLVTRLSEYEHFMKLQETTNDDVVQVEFNVNGTWKPTQNLSTGQKCSAILPILMLQNERPLVADEPEGHLDQRTLVDRVVQQIRAMTGKRQLIIATHNANIVALGDVGDTTVVVLSCDGGDRAGVTQGSVDRMRRDIEALLEGGKEAFKKRGDLYAKP